MVRHNREIMCLILLRFANTSLPGQLLPRVLRVNELSARRFSRRRSDQLESVLGAGVHGSEQLSAPQVLDKVKELSASGILLESLDDIFGRLRANHTYQCRPKRFSHRSTGRRAFDGMLTWVPRNRYQTAAVTLAMYVSDSPVQSGLTHTVRRN